MREGMIRYAFPIQTMLDVRFTFGTLVYAAPFI